MSDEKNPSHSAQALEELAALRSVGLLSPDDMNTYEQTFSNDPEFRKLAADLNDAASGLAVTSLGSLTPPPVDLRPRLLDGIGDATGPDAPLESLALDPSEAVVLTNTKGRIEWVSPAFSEMCGYSMAELRGRKPGALLQDSQTDPKTVARLRDAVNARQPISVSLRNYAKDGSAYWVALSISPIEGPDGTHRGFVAIEKELTDVEAHSRGLA